MFDIIQKQAVKRAKARKKNKKTKLDDESTI